MKRVHMKATRKTRAGLYRAGKDYYVPEDLAAALISEGTAIDLDKPEPEQATRTATEDAALRTKRPTAKGRAAR